MTFTNPDPSFADQANRVYSLYQRVADLRDNHSGGVTDARRVNLNNVMMAANGAVAVLRLLSWARQGGEAALLEALDLAKPEYVNLVAGDLLRSSRLFLLVESQFQVETMFRNILLALGRPAAKQGFYKVTDDLLKAVGLPNQASSLRTLNVPALLRNSMHANGIHHGYKGMDTVENVGGVEFRFEHGKPVHCGSWFHIVTALSSSFNVVGDILSSGSVAALRTIPDAYAAYSAAAAP